MRYLVISDIHANWEALEAVLHKTKRKRYDRVLFLGDAVGYGASANRVLDWLRSLSPAPLVVRGNHDRVCVGLEGGEYFNPQAFAAISWTRQHLDQRNFEWLRNLPEGPLVVEEDLAICHGAPHDEDVYIFSGFEATPAFEALPQQLVLFGHTHVPSLISLDTRGEAPFLRVELLRESMGPIDLQEGIRYLINPGSVGQPRDRDPRAAFAIFDSELNRLYHYRIPYSQISARKRILRAGLPVLLGDRLLHGV